MDLKHKPSAIRENRIFTLNKREIPISSAEADDNGAYISKGSAKQYYTYNLSGSTTAHKSENGAWYVKVKESKIYKREYACESNVFELTHLYRTSKHNPDFSRTIAFVRACNEKEPKPYYLVMYRWAREDQGPGDFVLPRHGNAARPTTSADYRKDPNVFTQIDEMLDKGMSTDRIYSSMAKEKEETVSQTVTGPKVIDNRKYVKKRHRKTSFNRTCGVRLKCLCPVFVRFQWLTALISAKNSMLVLTFCPTC